MLVGKRDFDEVVRNLSQTGSYGLDTETSGLTRKDRLFSVIFADETQGYYFNFNDQPDHLGHLAPDEYILPREWLDSLCQIVENRDSLFFLHNAKFDLSMLSKEGLIVLGSVHCTEAMERVLRNNHFKYSLKACAERRGLAKDDTVDAYIKEHGLFDKLVIPGKKKVSQLKHFDLVPFNVIAPYGCTDAVITRAIGLDQLAKMKLEDDSLPSNAPTRQGVVDNERRFTKALWRMEEVGAHIDRPYTLRALGWTQSEAERAKLEFQDMVGAPYKDSVDCFRPVFTKLGIEMPQTPTGRMCVDKAALEKLEHPIGAKIREIRGLEKLASTYYSSFLHFADSNDLIHANIRQGGTETGRLSYSDPNLQNLPKEDKESFRTKPYLVRRCFTPLNSDWVLVPIDFDQQEFRLMLDYAGETELIQQVMSGLDLHEATAQMAGITRAQAKTLNFGLLYGMGTAKLAKSLKISFREAEELKALYFEKLPKVQAFIRGVSFTAQKRGYIWNWNGFRNYCTFSSYAYKMPNALVQGSCGQVIRVATVKVDEYIAQNRLRSHMAAQVHDEILFQVHKSELHHVPEFQRLMEQTYVPKNGMHLTCSVEHGSKSWAKFDLSKGLPTTASAT